VDLVPPELFASAPLAAVLWMIARELRTLNAGIARLEGIVFGLRGLTLIPGGYDTPHVGVRAGAKESERGG
jgi:hypothetical protein